MSDYSEWEDRLNKRIADLEAENKTLQEWGKGMIEKMERREAEVERLNRFHELYCHPDCDCEASP